MLDEATTQDRAEDFVYEFSGKRRPQLAFYKMEDYLMDSHINQILTIMESYKNQQQCSQEL